MKNHFALFACIFFATAPALAQSAPPDSAGPSAPVEMPPKQKLPTCDAYYPAAEIAAKVDGITAVSFGVTSDGHLKNVAIAQSSGHADLDSAAVDCAENAHLSFQMQNQTPIVGGWIANGGKSVRWQHDGHSSFDPGCPYPIVSVRLREQGKVGLSFRISKDGTVAGATIAQPSGSQRLDYAALACMANYQYYPVIRGGVPTEIGWHTEMAFELRG